MQRTRVLFGMFVVVGILLPAYAFAQFVPVRDEQLINLFQRFSSSFDDFRNNDFMNYRDTFDDTFNTRGGQGSGNTITTGTSDSIRDLIAGANPGGIASEPCVVEYASDDVFNPSQLNDTTRSATKYWHSAAAGSDPEKSPWRSAYDASVAQGDILPDRIPSPESPSRTIWGATERPVVNTSSSLRCLLQELVEWKKLDLSIQIHMLLKQYISDAQTRMLANQLENQLANANVAFAREGYTSVDNGVRINAPLLVTNFNEYYYDRSDAQIRHLEAQILADPGDPIGAMGYNDHVKRAVAEQIANQTTNLTTKPIDAQVAASQSRIFDPTTGILPSTAAADEWYADPNTPLGPGVFLSMVYMNQSPQDTKLGAMTQAMYFAQERAEDERKNFERRVAQGGGVLDTTKDVVTDPAINPFGISDYQQSVTPAAQNIAIITAPYENIRAQLARTDSADQAPTAASQAAGYRSNVDGAITFNSYELSTTSNATHDIVKELYDTMWFGYFDLHPYTAEWAQATMLSIYDTLIFNSRVPSVVVSDAGTSPDSSGVGDESETPKEYPSTPDEIFYGP